MSNQVDQDDTFKICHCHACGAYSYPHETYACRVCGAFGDSLSAQTLSSGAILVNFVTVSAPIIKGIATPFVVGEVQLAPGVIEEAVIDVADESVLKLGMSLYPVKQTDDAAGIVWKFSPHQNEKATT